MERSRAGDLAVERIQGPESVLPGESFMITAWIDSPLKQTISYELLRGAADDRPRHAGRSRGHKPPDLPRHGRRADGVAEYTLHVTGTGADPVPENNTARLLVGVRAAKPLLCVTPSGAVRACRPCWPREGSRSRRVAASQCNWTLEELAGCSAVVLENTPASLLGHVGMENLAAWVTQSGGGLMITGGKDSYGPGGYYKSPLEPIMPVSMEMRREHRKLSVAIVVALDRSGSMAMPADGGRAKIDLADLATAEVIDMLGAKDQFGCIAVDTIPHTIVPLSDVTDKAAMRAPVLRIDSSGGGIYIYVALAEAARMIAPAKAGTKHIILFSDAADAEEPGDYKTARGQVREGRHHHQRRRPGHGEGLRRRTAQGHRPAGRRAVHVHQHRPGTAAVVRPGHLPHRPQRVPGGPGGRSLDRRADPPSRGRPWASFPRSAAITSAICGPSANLAVVSSDENQAPVLAAWQAGLGRVLCYTGEADGKYTGAIAGWKNAGEFFTSLARWTAGKPGELGRGAVPTQETAKRRLPRRVAPRSRPANESFCQPAVADDAFRTARRDGRGEIDRDAVVVGRHPAGRNPAQRQPDGPADDRCARFGTSDARLPCVCPTRRSIGRPTRTRAHAPWSDSPGRPAAWSG